MKESRLFNLNISEELRDKLRLEAFKKKTTLSAVAREILEEYFSNNENRNSEETIIKD